MKTFKQRRCKLWDPVFKFHWAIQRGGTRKSAIEWYCRITSSNKPEGTDYPEEGHYGVFYSNGNKNGLVWLKQDATGGAIAHEACHVTASMFNHMRMKLNEETEEVHAYYVQWLVEGIIKRLWN